MRKKWDNRRSGLWEGDCPQSPPFGRCHASAAVGTTALPQRLLRPPFRALGGRLSPVAAVWAVPRIGSGWDNRPPVAVATTAVPGLGRATVPSRRRLGGAMHRQRLGQPPSRSGCYNRRSGPWEGDCPQSPPFGRCHASAAVGTTALPQRLGQPPSRALGGRLSPVAAVWAVPRIGSGWDNRRSGLWEGDCPQSPSFGQCHASAAVGTTAVPGFGRATVPSRRRLGSAMHRQRLGQPPSRSGCYDRRSGLWEGDCPSRRRLGGARSFFK